MFVSKAVCSTKSSFLHLFRRFVHLGEHFTRGSLKEIELTVPQPLAGRKYLPSSDTPGFPKLLSGPRENYPLFVKAQNGQGASMKHWAKRSREVVDEAYRKYDKDGSAVAILFRGLPVSNENDFSEWVNNLGYQPFSYEGGTGLRIEIAENVDQGASDDKEFTIEPHSEMAYSRPYPKIFTVGSFKTAPWGGQTAMCDVREVFAKLDPSLVEKCEKKKLRYWHCLHDKDSKDNIYKSWQMQFMTDDRAKVNSDLEAKDYNYCWENDCLFYWNDLEPSIKHVRSGEYLWFNQIAANHCTYHQSMPRFEGVKLPNKQYPFHTTYGDGEEIERSVIDDHRRFTWECTVGFQWQDGDVLFLDQLIVQHSRLGFKGDRKIGISLLTY